MIPTSVVELVPKTMFNIWIDFSVNAQYASLPILIFAVQDNVKKFVDSYQCVAKNMDRHTFAWPLYWWGEWSGNKLIVDANPTSHSHLHLGLRDHEFQLNSAFLDTQQCLRILSDRIPRSFHLTSCTVWGHFGIRIISNQDRRILGILRLSFFASLSSRWRDEALVSKNFNPVKKMKAGGFSPSRFNSGVAELWW